MKAVFIFQDSWRRREPTYVSLCRCVIVCVGSHPPSPFSLLLHLLHLHLTFSLNLSRQLRGEVAGLSACSPFNLLYQTPLCCHPLGKRSLKQTPQTICSYFFSRLPLRVFPMGRIKSLPCSCFLYKSRDELQLIKRKLRGHPEVLGSGKKAVTAALVVAAVEKNIELYTHLGSI